MKAKWLLGVSMLVAAVGAQASQAGDCVVFCDGRLAGDGPRATAQECLDTLCLTDVLPCGCGSTIDCQFNGVSIMPPVVCGDGQRQGAEECDPGPNPYGEEDCNCPEQCKTDCTCPGGPIAARGESRSMAVA